MEPIIFPGKHKVIPPKDISEDAARIMCRACMEVMDLCAERGVIHGFGAITLAMAFSLRQTASYLSREGHEEQLEQKMMALIQQFLNDH
jgi:tRNA A58 N-methylase Trm61